MAGGGLSAAEQVADWLYPAEQRIRRGELSAKFRDRPRQRRRLELRGPVVGPGMPTLADAIPPRPFLGDTIYIPKDVADAFDMNAITVGNLAQTKPGPPLSAAVCSPFAQVRLNDWCPPGVPVADALASELHPRLLDTAARGGISVGGPGTGLTLFIAAAKQGRGELLRLCMRRDVELKAYEFDGGEPIKASMPDEVQPNFFERQPMRDLRALYAEAYPLNADVAAQHASDVIHEVIAFEASLHDGQNIKIGGHADVAIVDDHGTRWWLNEEAKRRLRNKNKKEKTRSKR